MSLTCVGLESLESLGSHSFIIFGTILVHSREGSVHMT